MSCGIAQLRKSLVGTGKALHLPTAKHRPQTWQLTAVFAVSLLWDWEGTKWGVILEHTENGLELHSTYSWLLPIKETHISEYFKIIWDLYYCICQGKVHSPSELSHWSMKSCAFCLFCYCCFYLFIFFNITSILSGKSSASVISELKVYSDSLLLWVESVLLCPGLGMLWSANETNQYCYMLLPVTVSS